METMYFEVVSIDGDYANLKRTELTQKFGQNVLLTF